MKKTKKMSDETTGYYIDLPENAQGVSVNGAEQVPISEYAEGIVVAETPTHYGTIEWTEDPISVEVDGNPVEVQPLIAGHHPTQRPK